MHQNCQPRSRCVRYGTAPAARRHLPNILADICDHPASLALSSYMRFRSAAVKRPRSLRAKFSTASNSSPEGRACLLRTVTPRVALQFGQVISCRSSMTTSWQDESFASSVTNSSPPTRHPSGGQGDRLSGFVTSPEKPGKSGVNATGSESRIKLQGDGLGQNSHLVTSMTIPPPQTRLYNENSIHERPRGQQWGENPQPVTPPATAESYPQAVAA